MKCATLAVGLLLLAGAARAEVPPPPDDVSLAYDAAVADLRAGKPRREVADRLERELAKLAGVQTFWGGLAEPFLADLMATADRPAAAADAPPEQRLADARDWGEAGPFGALEAADRSVFGRLIPLLTDRTPTRLGDRPFGMLDPRTPQPRVCDLALTLIEHHSKAVFYRNPYHGRNAMHFHALPEADRKQVTDRVTAWWAASKDKSVAAGLRDQLRHVRRTSGAESARVDMATALGKLPDATADDKTAAVEVLRALTAAGLNDLTSYSAAAGLAEIGDTAMLDQFARQWRADPAARRGGYVAMFLRDYGRRQEWELLREVAEREVAAGPAAGRESVLAIVLGGRTSQVNPYAVPVLAFVLTAVPHHPDAAHATSFLEEHAGRKFFPDTAPSPERAAAGVKAARAWWQAEGKAKYTFDAIDARRAAKP